MDMTERINLVIGHCREAEYPEPLIEVFSSYLATGESLAQVQQTWLAAQPLKNDLPPSFSTLFSNQETIFDELDQRRLDICLATNNLEMLLENLSDESPIEPLFHYLQQHGQQQAVLEYLMACYDWMSNDKPTSLGRLLLYYLPDHFPAMLPLMKQNNWDNEYEEFLNLLADVQPSPFGDLAWQTVQQIPQGYLGDSVAPLLKIDLNRFRAWAQQVASPNGPGDESDQVDALRALFDNDFANNLNLAVDIASGKRVFGNRWNTRRARQSAIETLFLHDPAQYLYLVDEAVASKEYALSRAALGLLEKVDQEQARPVLQRAVRVGMVYTAVQAARQLLEQEWEGRQAYALSLLAHKSKQVRDIAIEWLLPQGEALIQQVSPLLGDKSAYARLAAVEVVVKLHLGEERTRALLAGPLETEKAVSVKQAIVDAIGLPEPPADTNPAEAIAVLLGEAAVGGKKSPLCWFQAEEPTGVRWVNGETVPPAMIHFLLTSQARMRQMQLEMNARRVLFWLDRQTTGELALTLFTGWAKQGGNARESWCLPLIAALGDDRLIQLLRKQIDTLSRKSKRRQMSLKAVQTLALIGSDLALTEVSDLAMHAKNDQIQQAAREGFAEAAQRQGLSQEDLADRIAPRLGFDTQGQQILDFGPRQFIARLGFDQTIQLKDSTGKRLTLLPRGNARDDEAKVAAAQATWQVLKKHLAPAIKIQAERLENALSIQRAWTVERWRELFLQHPLLRSLAVNLVWGVLDASGTSYTTIFRPLEDGSLTNADDDACALPAAGLIRMVHPIELNEDTRQSWLQHLTDYEVTPPFPQLNRALITNDDTTPDAIWWTPYQGYRVAGKLIKERYVRSNWEPGNNERGESYNLIWKAFPSAGFEALLEISYLSVGYERAWPTTIIRLGFGRAGTVERIKQATKAAAESDDNNTYDYYHPQKIDETALLKLVDIPAVVFSEAAASVQAFAALGHYDEEWQKKADEDPDNDDDIPF
jgi:hypothetical protein